MTKVNSPQKGSDLRDAQKGSQEQRDKLRQRIVVLLRHGQVVVPRQPQQCHCYWITTMTMPLLRRRVCTVGRHQTAVVTPKKECRRPQTYQQNYRKDDTQPRLDPSHRSTRHGCLALRLSHLRKLFLHFLHEDLQEVNFRKVSMLRLVIAWIRI